VTGLYLDASAIVKLIIQEEEWAALLRVVRGQVLFSSRITVVEVGKAVARSRPGADMRTALSRISFVELDADLAQIAGVTGGNALRALDAIHVASALRLGPELDSFVTYDERQAEAARSAGLEVMSPK
jgi:predicted nucleic acid-binding protein